MESVYYGRGKYGLGRAKHSQRQGTLLGRADLWVSPRQEEGSSAGLLPTTLRGGGASRRARVAHLRNQDFGHAVEAQDANEVAQREELRQRHHAGQGPEKQAGGRRVVSQRGEEHLLFRPRWGKCGKLGMKSHIGLEAVLRDASYPASAVSSDWRLAKPLSMEAASSLGASGVPSGRLSARPRPHSQRWRSLRVRLRWRSDPAGTPRAQHTGSAPAAAR